MVEPNGIVAPIVGMPMPIVGIGMAIGCIIGIAGCIGIAVGTSSNEKAPLTCRRSS